MTEEDRLWAKKSSQQPKTDLKDLSFEEALARLDETVQAMEAGGLTLAEATRLFEEGMRLARLCSEQLAAAELKISRIQTAYGRADALPGRRPGRGRGRALLKADFHMHSHFSPDSELSPEQIVARCIEVGLDCVAVTDHNTIDGALAVRELASFFVIIGEEVKSSEGEITGLFLKETIPRGLSALDTVERIKEQGGLVSIPHPFDRFRRSVISRDALEKILPYTDIVEVFNSRNHVGSDNRRAQEYAHEHGLLASAVSDAHTSIELGRTYVEMPEFDGTPEGFKWSLAQGRIVGRQITPLIHLLTTFTKIRKRLLSRTGRKA